MAPVVELRYYKIRSWGEMIRLALAEADVEYTNIFVPEQESLEDCQRMGGHLTTNIPLISIDGVHYTQSLAILRKIGRDFADGRLYPKDKPDLLYQIDMLIDAAFDLRSLCYDAYSTAISSCLKMRDISVDVQSTHLRNFERLLSAMPYMCGADFTLADISVYDALANWADRLLPGVLDRFPTLRAYVNRVASRPRLAAWLASETAVMIGKEDGDGEDPLWQLTEAGIKSARSEARSKGRSTPRRSTRKATTNGQRKLAKLKPSLAKKPAQRTTRVVKQTSTSGRSL